MIIAGEADVRTVPLAEYIQKNSSVKGEVN